MRFPVRISEDDRGGSYPGISEVTTNRWFKRPGERVKVGEKLVEIEIEKATVEKKSPADGVLIEIILDDGADFKIDSDKTEISAGGTVFFTTVLGYIETGNDESVSEEASLPGEHIDAPARDAAPPPIVPVILATPVATRMMEKHGISPEQIQTRNRFGKIDKEQVETYLRGIGGPAQINQPTISSSQLEEAPPAPVPTPIAREASLNNEVSVDEVRATPAARTLARERGIDLVTAGIRGSGPGGIIATEDIPSEAHTQTTIIESRPTVTSEEPTARQVKAHDSEEDEQPIVLSPIQQAVARNIEKGWRIPTAMAMAQYDLGVLASFRTLYAKKFETKIGVRLQLAFPFAAAVVRVLAKDEFKRHLNGYVSIDPTGGKYKFIPSKGVNLGIAFNTPENDLVILTVRNAQALSLRDLARATTNLQKKSQETFTAADARRFSVIFNNLGGLISLFSKENRAKVRNIGGYSLLTENIAMQIDLGDLGKDGWASVLITLDHRAINYGHLTSFMDAVLTELYERVIPELQALCDEQ